MDIIIEILKDNKLIVSRNWLLNNQDFPPGLYDINFDKASVTYLIHKNLSKSFSNNP